MKESTPRISLFSLVPSVLFLLLLSSCGSSKKINYDYLYFRNGSNSVKVQQKETLIQPNDLLGIQVFSRTLNQEQAAIFNLPNSPNNAVQGQQVSAAGNIELPVIGSIKAAGLTRSQLQTSIAEKLPNYVKDPSVIVRFLQFNVNVLGEVRSPGVQQFSVDKVTIIDAISAAGDLTDNGRREDIALIREENGRRVYYTVDMRTRNIFESPVYLLQPNDIVYVSPNNNKLRSLSANPDAQRKTGMFFSILSAVLSVSTLFVYLLQ